MTALRGIVGAAIICSGSCFGAGPVLPHGALAHAVRGVQTARSCRSVGGGADEVGRGADLCRVRFKGAEVEARRGETLRTALLRSGAVTPHNGRSQLINCRGLGTCGTCAVAIRGNVSPPRWNSKERLRLNFPPHACGSYERLRLACQKETWMSPSLTSFGGRGLRRPATAPFRSRSGSSSTCWMRTGDRTRSIRIGEL